MSEIIIKFSKFLSYKEFNEIQQKLYEFLKDVEIIGKRIQK